MRVYIHYTQNRHAHTQQQMMCRLRRRVLFFLHIKSLYPFTGLYVDMANEEKILPMLEPQFLRFKANISLV